MEDAVARDTRCAEEKFFFSAASFALAGVILILALCDLEILFTSY